MDKISSTVLGVLAGAAALCVTAWLVVKNSDDAEKAVSLANNNGDFRFTECDDQDKTAEA